MEISRIFEFDAGHRIPNHSSECRNLHGHRYKLELTLEGNILEDSGASHEGMVLDFSDIKIITNKMIDQVDHSFIVYNKDEEMIKFLKLSDSKYTVLPNIPTVENIAQYLLEKLKPNFEATYNQSLVIKKITLWETPNCFVTLDNIQ